MNDLNTILHQVNKKRFVLKECNWVTVEQLYPEHSLPGSVVRETDHIYETRKNYTSFNKIKNQLQKKKPSRKTRQQRVADKTILLSDRLSKGYK
jgi:hypothetical protein